MTETAPEPGRIEIDTEGSVPRVRFTLPQEWFTLPQLRQFAAYLTLVADENEPSPDVDALAQALETAAFVGQSYRATAYALVAAGYKREGPLAEPEVTPALPSWMILLLSHDGRMMGP